MAPALLRAFGLLLMLSAAALALSRAPDRPVESLVARWAPAPSDFIELSGQLVHLRDQGPRDDPHPVVLLHGIGSSLHTWEGWVGLLAARRRVVTLDLPGNGLTGPWSGAYAGRDYRAATLARWLPELLDRLGLDRVVLGGHSFGGEVAWRVAALAPARVERLVLVDATGALCEPPPSRAGPGPPGLKPSGKATSACDPHALPLVWRVARVPAIATIAEHVTPRALVAQALATAVADPARLGEAQIDRYFELALRAGNRRAMLEAIREWEPGADAAALSTLALPTLIVWGAADRVVPPAVGAALQARIAGSRLVVVAGVGHLPQEENPARSVLPVREFLEPRRR